MDSTNSDIMSPNTKLFANGDGDIKIKDSANIFSPTGDRRTLFKRAFGKLEKGSLRGSVFALCASAIGSGVLGLPYVLRLNGWVEGFILIVIGAIAGCWSLFMIADSAIKAKVMNMSRLANHVGGKALELFLQINILIYMWGSCISY